MDNTPRPVIAKDMGPLARLWHESWHHAHARHIPSELVKRRNVQAFADRLPGLADNMRVIGPVGSPLGLCCIESSEISQIFIATPAQGTGIAQALMTDGEARIAALGHSSAWLKVVPGNQRAIAFYRKLGWSESGRETIQPTPSLSKIAVELLIFRKAVTIHGVAN